MDSADHHRANCRPSLIPLEFPRTASIALNDQAGSPFEPACPDRHPAGLRVHRGATFPGQHEAIVDQETFEAIRRRLAGNATQRRSATNAGAPSLLTGLIYDETGERLCPTHTSKRGRRYRNYISKRLMHRSASDETGWRLLGRLGAILTGAIAVAAELAHGQAERRRVILHRMIQRVELSPDVLRLELKRSDLLQLINADETRQEKPPPKDRSRSPVLLRRRADDNRRGRFDRSTRQTARQRCRSVSPLAFLAPGIVTAILDGRQPVELTTKRLSRIGALPLSWEIQRRLLGFAA